MSNTISSTQKLSQLIQEKQFYWWLGHVCVVINGIIYFGSVLSFYSNPVHYRGAYMGALMSYAIVIYNSIESTKEDRYTRLLYDENVHYFVMALYWYFSTPMTVTLVPFFIYSLFHAFKYTNTLIRLFIPEKEKESLLGKLEGSIQHTTESVHILAIQYAAHIEVIIIPFQLILGILTLHTSVLSIIIFIHFLRLRYCLSRPTQDAVAHLTYYLDQWLAPKKHQSRSLRVFSKLYINLKRFMARYGHINKSA
ncbi:hypothetical protein BY458DRAFT_504955 [Sporodiniella umbellata]|nr:hypothetical protein BY458DRAFT_504955 [Sporodiniella umbellata]